MPLRFSYRRGRVNHPVISLGGRFSRPRPTLVVGLIGPTGDRVSEALLDTGADDTVFRESLASSIGIDLTNAPARNLTDIGPVGYRVRYAELRLLRLTDGKEFREWPAWVGFTDAPLPIATLGFAGCLQFFTATFHGDFEEATMAVNPLYPGV